MTQQVAARVAGRLLRTRRLVRAPILLYRLRLGWLLGPRFLLLEHVGRTSGRRRHVLVEVLSRPDADHVVVASGFGRRAQWYCNLEANPAVRVSTGRIRDRPARAELLGEEDAASLLRDYAREHGRALRRLTDALATAAPGGEVDIRLVRLRLLPG
ncbi:nitroreductase family deazaflavin-dependent oxidoreductase [Geodermatophilus marinus]|uniref:nitroreductase family deazaflavin-dependent oxidoreductase n=1 Tax=Geodermatophilus sp. LHW52908 TaxID=2303986 RepID=UPI000E3CB1E5|nr:nitroreductase family deazaflavin-dependent oxidoreductase [Geodermatophilus sp. LHW52908]RFU19234.1 nitroreductase family deazaflavin-dependent oxidoreductase [Geodermatophilus sp. LHW52908]